MIVSSLVGVSLIVSVALDTGEVPAPAFSDLQLSMRQKEAALLPLVQIATECVVRSVMQDARYRAELRPGEINDLIVDSMASCSEPLRAMIDAHDRMFGLGSGDAFFLGPYLDVLPAAVTQHATAPRAPITLRDVPATPAAGSPPAATSAAPFPPPASATPAR